MGEDTRRSASDVVLRAVGAELRAARLNRGMTLAQVADNLQSGIRVPTLSGYETGTKTIHVGRMVEICAAIGAHPPAVLTAAMKRAELGLAAFGVLVDLRSVVDGASTRLEPVRSWARTKLAENAEAVTMIDPEMIRDMAGFCGLSVQTVAAELERFAPA